ncbi:unnamed protein product, partial [Rotaria magnacalcarata]
QAQIKYSVGRKPTYVLSGDFNNDNNMDIAVVNQLSNDMFLMLGDENAKFPEQIQYATDNTPGPAVAYDPNQDGKLDIALLSEVSNKLDVLINQCE